MDGMFQHDTPVLYKPLPSPQSLTLSICGDVLLAADLLVSAERESIRPHGVTVEALYLLLVAGARPVRPHPRG